MEHANVQHRSWWRRPGWIIPLAVVALVVIGIVGARVTARAGLKRELAAARAKGLPTNPKELDAWYAAVPAAENAALKVMEAQGLLVEEPEELKELRWSALESDDRLNPLFTVRLEEHLRKNEETLKLLHEAAELKRSRYPTDLSKGSETSFIHIFRIKQLAELLRFEAAFRAERGDSPGTVKALRSGFALAGTLAEEPVLISELVRIACVSILLTGMERVVSVAQLSEGELAELSEVVRKAEESCPRALHRALAGERAFGNTGRRISFEEYEQTGAIGMLAGGGGLGWVHDAPEFARKFLYDLRGVVGIHDRDMSFYMRGLGRLIEASERPDFFAATESVKAELTAELAEHPYVYLLSGMSLPIMFGAPNKEVRILATLRCARVALEMERMRARTGRLPKIEELVPGVFAELPRDPVDGKALEVRELVEGGKGYEVVAVATDSELRKKVSPNGRAVAFKVVRARAWQREND
jgi:hypothetical protein